jgi:hypothetical protein
MPKSDVVRPARFKQGRLRADELPDAVEGQIAEICRDFAVQLSLVTSRRRANYLTRRRTARRVRAPLMCVERTRVRAGAAPLHQVSMMCSIRDSAARTQRLY